MIFERFERTAADHHDVTAVSNETAAMTYGHLLDAAGAVRDFLETPRPALVLLAVPGGPCFTATQIGAAGAKAVLAPIPHTSTRREVEPIFDLVAPDMVVVSSLSDQAAVVSALREPATVVSLDPADSGTAHEAHRVVTWDAVVSGAARLDREPRSSPVPPEVRMVQFTSGSTAAPKGILLTEDNLDANLQANREHLEGFRGAPVFCPVPQFHAMGNAVVLEHVTHGSPVHVANRFLPGSDVGRMTAEGCVAILASPNYFKLLLTLKVLSPARLPELRSFTVGTAAVDARLVSDLRAAYPRATVHCRYGLSESVGALTRLDLPPGATEYLPGLAGALVPGTELAPGLSPPDEGPPREIVVKGPSIGLGQLVERGRWEPLTDDSGYLHTGDLGCVDHQGRLHLRGRSSSFLKVNGQRISPFEIEIALGSAPGVHEAVVVGAPDPLSGQRIVACLEPRAGQALDDTTAVADFCRAELAPYKVPHRFIVYDRLPRTAAGKPDRARLRKEMEE